MKNKRVRNKKYFHLMICILCLLVFAGCGPALDSGQSMTTVHRLVLPEQEQGFLIDSSNLEKEPELEQTEETYQKGKLIPEQTFEVTLSPLGEVTFASYEPDTSVNAFTDVVFLIEQDGKVLFQLPGTTEDNVGYEQFCQVEAVSFFDYDHDNYDDIIVIVSYDPGAGDQAATPHSTVRYYRGTKEGTQAIEEYRK